MADGVSASDLFIDFFPSLAYRSAESCHSLKSNGVQRYDLQVLILLSA